MALLLDARMHHCTLLPCTFLTFSCRSSTEISLSNSNVSKDVEAAALEMRRAASKGSLEGQPRDEAALEMRRTQFYRLPAAYRSLLEANAVSVADTSLLTVRNGIEDCNLDNRRSAVAEEDMDTARDGPIAAAIKQKKREERALEIIVV
jgi:hypothetical protein